METLRAIFTRRSIRAYTDEPIDPQILHQLLEVAQAASSGGNVQPWGFVVVQSPKRLAALRALSPGIIGTPAAVICLCLDQERAIAFGGDEGEQIAWLSLGLVTQNVLLAAHALGLGACPVASFHKGGVSLFLGLPESVSPVLMITVGHPAVRPPSPGRRPLSDIVFAEHWGHPYE